MKYVHVNTLFLMLVFHTSCGQNKPDLPKDNISKGLYSESQVKEAATSKVPMSMVRNVKQARNGDILIASYLGVFRYDGKSFTNLTSKIISPRFSSFWDVLEDRKGNLWFGDVDGLWRYDGRTCTKLSQRGAYAIIEDKKGNIWTTAGAVLSRYDAKSLYSKKPTVTEIKSESVMLLGILEDAKGNIWFGSGGGVYRYDGKTITDFKSTAGQK